MEKEYIKASEYAKKMSLHIRTVYRYYHNGKIKGYQDKETGTIFILNPFKSKNEDNLENKVVLYARVSSSENKTNLESQLEKLRLFASAKGYQIVKEIKEVGSGLNDNRSKLNYLLEKELKEKIDLTLPVQSEIGTIHPIQQIIDDQIKIFTEMGYEVVEGPETETTYNIFDMLNTPKDHPAREMQDTFYLSENVVLRSQTSAIQIRKMLEGDLPIKMICPRKSI